MRRLAVVGQGYVGLTLALRAVEVGYDVVGYDIDLRKTSSLAAGGSEIDDISQRAIESALATGRYQPTSASHDLSDFDVAVIAVPTPVRSGLPDTSFIESAAKTLARWLRPGSMVVLESTCSPGTTEDVLVPILEEHSGIRAGTDFQVGYSPERIDPGNTKWTFESTPKLVSGIDPTSLLRVDRFYRDLVTTTVRMNGTREAELAKLLENTFRQVNIALVNSMAVYSHLSGIDFWNVLDGAATKPFGFMPFRPGPGVGGNCIPVDPLYLSWPVEQSSSPVFQLASLAHEINDQMPFYVFERLRSGLAARGKVLTDCRVLVLGLAYKPNSSETAHSPSTELILKLLSGGAEVRVHDSHVGRCELDDRALRVDELSDWDLATADAVVVMADHDDVDYKRVSTLADYVFDTRGRMAKSDNVEHL